MFNVMLVTAISKIEDKVFSEIDWEKDGIKISGQVSIDRAYKEITTKSLNLIVIDSIEDKDKIIHLLKKLSHKKLRFLILGSYNLISDIEETLRTYSCKYLYTPCNPLNVFKEILDIKAESNLKEKNRLDFFKKNISIMKESMLREIIYGNISDINTIVELIPFYNINLINTNTVVSIVKISNIKIINLIKEYIINNLDYSGHFEVINNKDGLILILCLENNFSYDDLINLCNKLKNALKAEFDTSAIISIGSIITSLRELNCSFKAAKSTLESMILIKKDVVISSYDTINNTTKVDTNNELIKSAIEYIEEHYSDNTLTLVKVAEEIYITPVYLSKLFKQKTGVNFLDYLHKYRIEQAKNYLLKKDIKIYEISNLVGYGNEKHFSKMFKKYVGKNPTKYRDLLM